MHEPTVSDFAMDCTPSEAEMIDMPPTWISPDGSFCKHITKPGHGVTAPNDGATCLITIHISGVDENSAEQPDIGYPGGREVEVILGEGCGVFSEVIDACLESMHTGEECKLSVPAQNDADVERGNRSEGDILMQDSDRSVTEETSGGKWKYLCSITLHSFTRNRDIFQMSVADILTRVAKLKTLGSQCFKDAKRHQAEWFYIRALRYLVSICHPKDVANLVDDDKKQYWELRTACSLNLAACQLRHKRYADVILNCGNALDSDPRNMKGLYRRCQAYLALDEFESARADVKLALSVEPKNKLFLEQHRLIVKREKQVFNKLSHGMNKMFGGPS